MIDWKPLIKTIKEIIQKEKAHLSMLTNRNAPKKYIDTSIQMLEHYKSRLFQYESEDKKNEIK